MPNRLYIQAGDRSTFGYFSRHSLPSFENSGPIPYNFQSRMQYPLRPSFVGLTLVQWRFVFDDWESIRVDTLDENYKITLQSLPIVDNFLIASA